MTYPDTLRQMQSRRSIREFTDRPLTREDIEKLIEAARWAPSNHNRQGWTFIVFEDREELHALAKEIRSALASRVEGTKIPTQQAEDMLHHATFFADAPAVILVMHKKPVAMVKSLLANNSDGALASGEAISAAMATQNLLLAADALGLGACVLTAPLLASDVWAQLTDLPQGFLPTCVVAVGYPATAPDAPRRKPLGQIMEYRNNDTQ